MTVPSWPAELPRPQRPGFAQSGGDNRRLAQGNDAGVSRVARGWTLRAQPLSMAVRLSIDQLARFERFYEEDLGAGTIAFTMPDWPVDGLPLEDEAGNIVTNEHGDPIILAATNLVRFGPNTYSAAVRGVKMTVTMDLVILP